MTDRSAARLYRRMARGRITFRQYFNILWHTGAQYDRRQYGRVRAIEWRRAYASMAIAGLWYFAVFAAWLLGYLPFWVYGGVAVALAAAFVALAAATQLQRRHLDRED